MAMTTATRDSANSAVMTKLNEMFPNGVMIAEGKKIALAIPTGVINEKNGLELWASVAVTVKNNDATEKVAAFDLDAAHEAYETMMAERAEKASAPKKSTKVDDEKRAANAAKRHAQAAIVSKFVREEMEDGVEMSATDILNACPELVEQGVRALDMGKIMDEVCGEQILNFERKAGKKWYSKA